MWGRQVRPRWRSRGVMYAGQTAGCRSIRLGPRNHFNHRGEGV
nr:MAG TPA: hypothetical protein [Caudoviricetes sp.]DAP77415.1 MAG TPA: hypothetical protein [Caudoviricetes sp.]